MAPVAAPAEVPAWDSHCTPRSRSASTRSWPSMPRWSSASTAAWACWSTGLKQRGLLDNTLILFLSDNGGNAEGGPPGITAATGPIGGPQSYVLSGMNWATLNNTPFLPLQALHARRRHQFALHRSLAPGIPAERRGNLEKQPAHLIDVMATAVDLAGASIRASSKATPSCRWKASPCARLSQVNRSTAHSHLLGARGKQSSARREMEAGAEMARPLGAVRH